MDDNRKKITITLKKARTHLDKILEMIENDEYCIDIIQQLNAVEGYLESAKKRKLRDHFYSCFIGQMQEDEESRKKHIEEVLRIMKMTV